MMHSWKSFFATTALCFVCSAEVWANGWGSGQNFVPLIEDIIAEDTTGERLPLHRGTPIHVSFGEGNLKTSVRWETRPYEREVTVPRQSLPEELAGFRQYHEGEFEQAETLLASEAADADDSLIRNWKWILAGHAHLLAEPESYDAAIAYYARAAQSPEDAFAEHGAYFAARALLATEDYRSALARLTQAHEWQPDGLNDTVLFSTYPQSNSELAAWSVHLPKLDEAIPALKDLIETIDAREALPIDAKDVEIAEAMYAEANAREALFLVMPDRFYDIPRPTRAPELLLEIVERFPDTDTAERAYKDYVFTYERIVEYEGDPKDEEERLRKIFLKKYPASDLVERAPSTDVK